MKERPMATTSLLIFDFKEKRVVEVQNVDSPENGDSKPFDVPAELVTTASGTPPASESNVS
jgi:hypothetical protein